MSIKEITQLALIACVGGLGVALLEGWYEGLIAGMAACASYVVGLNANLAQLEKNEEDKKA